MTLSRNERQQILRVAGEALSNVHQHSPGARVRVGLRSLGNDCVLTIEDDGVGFDPMDPRLEGDGHFGLQIMKARANRLGGQLSIQTAPREGTRVTLRWSLSERVRETSRV